MAARARSKDAPSICDNVFGIARRGVTNAGIDSDPDLDFHPFWTFYDSHCESESTAH